jgi:arabinofuranosyltransferase
MLFFSGEGPFPLGGPATRARSRFAVISSAPMGGLSRGARLAAPSIIASFVIHAALFLGATIDDAYIAFRYAHNFASGLGLVFNPGERVEGFTSFAWVLLSALCFRVGARPEVLMPLFGLAAGLGLTVLVLRAGARLPAQPASEPAQAPPHPDARAGLFAGALLVLTPGVPFYAVSGLEHTFFTLLLTLAVLALVERRLVAWALFTCLAFLTRPEAALLGPLGLVLLANDLRKARSSGTRLWLSDLWKAALVFVLLLAPYLAFKWQYFGSVVPKEPELGLATHYTLTGVWPSALLAALALNAALKGKLARPRVELLFVWFAYVLACVFVGPDWMPVYRFFVPQLPCLALAVSPLLVRAWDERALLRRALPVLLALLVYVVPQLVKSARLVESTRLWDARDDRGRAIARSLLERGVRDVATINIGLLAYEMPDVPFTDLGGLVDREIGTGPGGHLAKHPADAYLLGRDPDVFVLTSERPPTVREGRGLYVPDYEVERHVFSRPWFAERYSYGGTARLNAVQYYSFFFRKRQ